MFNLTKRKARKDGDLIGHSILTGLQQCYIERQSSHPLESIVLSLSNAWAISQLEIQEAGLSYTLNLVERFIPQIYKCAYAFYYGKHTLNENRVADLQMPYYTKIQ